MRRLPRWAWLVLAGLFGLAAALVAVGMLRAPSWQPPETGVQWARVVVAARDITPGTEMTPDCLRVDSHWHPESRPAGAFAAVEKLQGRVTAYPLAAGEPILEGKLAPLGAVAGLTALLSPSKRAMTVKVDEASGVAGFLSPDNRVDVVVTLDKGDFSSAPLSKVVLQNLRVLGTGQRIEKRPGDKPQVVPTVTLEVSPEEGEALALAAQGGRISLVLRNSSDEKLVATPGMTAHRLLGQVPRPARSGEAGSAKPARSSVEVLRGLNRESVTF
jgi:pilus assembly protein CpaB